MKALSLRQPWAWAILALGKRIENRRWNTHYRGPILLHAAKGCRPRECFDALAWMIDRELLRDSQWPGLDYVARGGIVGRARIVDVIRPWQSTPKSAPPFVQAMRPNTWGVDVTWHMREQFGFVLADVEALPFRPCRGTLGLFELPEAA